VPYATTDRTHRKSGASVVENDPWAMYAVRPEPSAGERKFRLPGIAGMVGVGHIMKEGLDTVVKVVDRLFSAWLLNDSR
jgi:hypothetical protein